MTSTSSVPSVPEGKNGDSVNASVNANDNFSHTMSFASPESDFTGHIDKSKLAEAEASTYEHSHTMSFASPESDFTGHIDKSKLAEAEASTYEPYEHSQTLSFASPESDFTGHIDKSKLAEASTYEPYEHSQTLSFASPESDFTGANASSPISVPVESSSESEFSYSLSFSSPESDFTGVPLTPVQKMQMDEAFSGTQDIFPDDPVEKASESDFSYSMSLSSPESDFTGLPLTPIQKQQLRKLIVNDLAPHSAPITMSEALASTGEAKVITSAVAPFAIKHVNTEWVSLCGFSVEEVRMEKIH